MGKSNGKSWRVYQMLKNRGVNQMLKLGGILKVKSRFKSDVKIQVYIICLKLGGAEIKC